MNSVKRMKRVVFVLGLAFALGGLLLAPQAQAAGPTTSSAVSVVPGAADTGVWGATTSTSAIFMKGLDGGIWYTLVNTAGAAPITGVNANNPFIGGPVTWNADGFVSRTGAGALSSSGACAATGQSANSCSAIWAKVPGAGTFTDSPSASLGGPISGAAQVINLVVPGLDSQLYYTLFSGAVGAANVFGTSGTTVAANDPFGGAGIFTAQPAEVSDTGWPSTLSTGQLQLNCAVVSRTCVGLWVPMP